MSLAFLAAINVAVTVSWDGAANDGAEGTAETVMIERKDVMAASKSAFQTGTSQQQRNFYANADLTMKHQLQNNSLF